MKYGDIIGQMSPRPDLLEEAADTTRIGLSMRIGRNHPCPCGSGKKYKLCCMNMDKVRAAGAGRAAGIAWLRMRRTEGKLGPILGHHALEHYGPQSMAEAWDDFTLWAALGH